MRTNITEKLICLNLIHFTKDKIHLNYKKNSLQFAPLNTISDKFTSICLLAFDSLEICFTFASNSFNICVYIVSHSVQTRFKFTSNLFRNSLLLISVLQKKVFFFFKFFRNFERNTTVLEYLVSKLGGLQPTTLFKSILSHNCFPMNSAKFLTGFKFQKQLFSEK